MKELRLKSGFTQVELAKKAGVSLRTIQRFESGKQTPKGHSLQVISEALDVEKEDLVFKKPSAEQSSNPSIDTGSEKVTESDFLSLKLINIAALAFLIIPFGNLILPIILWRKKRSSEVVYQLGRKLINFQLLWTLLLVISLSITPFINIRFLITTPLVLYMLFFALLINIVVICSTANKMNQERTDFLESLPQLI